MGSNPSVSATRLRGFGDYWIPRFLVMPREACPREGGERGIQ